MRKLTKVKETIVDLSLHSGLGVRPASLYSRKLRKLEWLKLEATEGNSRELLLMLVTAQ